MIYIEEYAGAIITSKNIEYSSLLDNPNVATELKDYTGLGLWDKYILPHSNEFPFEECTAELFEITLKNWTYFRLTIILLLL